MIMITIYFNIIYNHINLDKIFNEFSKETRNKIFKDIETETFVAKFKATFEKQEKQYRNPKFF